MGGIHEAIEERWQATAGLLSLVPLRQQVVGNFPAKSRDTLAYPYVNREIQTEQKESYTSDGKIYRATILFTCNSYKHEDGQAFREAFAGTPGVDGFENARFETVDVAVLKSRELDFGEFQDDDGMWAFLMSVEFVWRKLPPVIIITPTSSLMYSQTAAASVSNTATETTLISTGAGTVTVPTNSQAVGDKFIIEASGFYDSKAAGPGNVVFRVKWGSGALNLATPVINLVGAQNDARWKLRSEITRRSIGGSGVVRANIAVFMQNAADGLILAGTAADVTVPTDSAQAFDVTADFSVADASNTINVEQLDIEQKTVGV